MKNALAAALILATLALALAPPAAAHSFDQTYEAAAEAVQTYQKLVDDYPEDLDLRYRLADMQIRAGQLDPAAKTLAELLRLDPKRDAAHYRLAEIHYRKGEFDKALARLKLIADPAMKDDRLVAEATVLIAMNKPAEALKAARRAAAADPKNPGAPLQAALALQKLGKPEKALAETKKSLLLDPAQTDTAALFILLLNKTRPITGQISALQSLLEKIPKDYKTAALIKRQIEELQDQKEKK